MSRLTTSLVAFVVASACATAHAVEPLIEGETFRLDLGGYFSGFTGVQYTPYDNPLVEDSTTGINASIARLEWGGQVTDNVSFTLHNRFFWTMTSQPALAGGAVGLGSTVPPERTLDLQTFILEKDTLTLEHDLDRFAVNVFTPVADITLGRQAVTWGVASLFAVSDIWTQFSPFELDTSQKRGVDAIRLLAYPWEMELDVLVVDRGSLEDLSGGARLGWSGESADYFAAVAKSYQRVWGLMGVAADLEYFRVYGELGLPVDLDAGELALPRATAGVDYMRTDLTLTFEYHLNGYGTTDTGEYLAELSSAEMSRGEQYFAGRHLAGTAVSYMAREDLTLVLAALGNLTDPSVVLTPTVGYELVQDVNLKLGAYLGLGDTPEIQLTSFDIGSEFGAYGHFYFMELSAFF